jgi:hypothetical protein
MTAARAVGGFVLGAILVVATPPIGLAMALVLLGVLGWLRWRHEEPEGFGPPAFGFLAAVGAYVLLVLLGRLA